MTHIISKQPKARILLSGLFLSMIFLFFSCDSGQNSSSILYTSTGKTSELLLVIPEGYYDSFLGDSLRSSLQEVKPWLSREEPFLDLHVIPNQAFRGIYQKFRNVLIIQIDDSYSENQIKARNNVFAKPQTVIELKAKDRKNMLNLFNEHSEQIKQLFYENELKRILEAYKGLEVDSLNDYMQAKFGFTMVFPKGFYVAKDKADFVWLKKETPDIDEGFLIYTEPYTDTSAFHLDSIIARRNAHTYKYIPGPMANTWMKTSDVFPPYYKETEFQGNYAVLVRSWWDLQNYPLGGPYLSYTMVDTVASRLITIDGYILAPKKEKRDILLHLEAIMSSFHMD